MENNFEFSSKSLGERLKKIRNDNGYSRDQLAELFKVSRASIQNYENGERSPNADYLVQFYETMIRTFRRSYSFMRETFTSFVNKRFISQTYTEGLWIFSLKFRLFPQILIDYSLYEKRDITPKR